MRNLTPALFSLECVLDRRNTFRESLQRTYAMYNLSDRDRGLVSRLVADDLRHHLLLREQVAEALPRFANSEPQLRLGALGLQLLRGTPNARKRSVLELVHRTSEELQLSFTDEDLDALLTLAFAPSAVPSKFASDPVLNNALILNCPAWVLQSYAADYGWEKAVDILRRQNTLSPLYLTVNTLRAKGEDFAEDSRFQVLSSDSPDYPEGASLRCLDTEVHASEIPEVQDGLAFAQDLSWFRFLDALPFPQYCRVLHVHAKDGFISAGLALRAFRAAGTVTACFPTLENQDRARQVQGKLGIGNVRAIVSSTQMLKTSLEFDAFDLVVVTPTNSHLGQAGRRPEVLPTFDPDTLGGTVESEREELLEASFFTAPGGLLAYAVPSILRHEGEGVAEWFTESRREFREVSSRTLLPAEDGGYGLFYAVFRRDY